MNLRKVLVLGTILSVLIFVGACSSPSLSLGATESGGQSEDSTAKAAAAESADAEPAQNESMTESTEEDMGDEAAAADMADTGETMPPMVNEVLNQIPMVQHHHDPETNIDTFTCASRGLGVMGVEPDPNGPRYVGPNSGDFDLWGAVGLFRVDPDGGIFFVPQQTGGKFVDKDGVEQEVYSLEQTLEFFASGEAKWLSGAHGEPGRIAECDPQYPVK